MPLQIPQPPIQSQTLLRMETYFGHVKTPNDAIILFEACKLGSLPRVQRRLSEKERQQIRSGSVFVWDEREAGMRRWTDGKSWSASRVSGSFLTYREMEGKRTGGSNFTSPALGSGAPHCDQADVSDAPDGYRYKADGLVKQSFSITTNDGQHLHLISYFARADPAAASLPSPLHDPALRHIRPPKGVYPDSTGHDGQLIPAVTRSPMPESPYNSSPAYGHTQAHMRHAPPNFAWPPSPHHTPPAMAAHYPPNYFPYPYPGPNGVPLWPHPAFLTPQRLVPSGQTAFDRAPPPLRSAGIPPPPPPAPAHPYPQHRQPSYIAPPNYASPPPHLSTPTSPIAAIPSITRKRSHTAMNNHSPHIDTSADARAALKPTHDPAASTLRPLLQTSYEDSLASREPSQRPSSSPHADTKSVHGVSTTSKNIPSINSLINKSPSQSPALAPAKPTYSQYANGSPKTFPAPSRSQEYGARQSEVRASESQDKGAPQQPGYGEDVNALRRLDRAFAP